MFVLMNKFLNKSLMMHDGTNKQVLNNFWRMHVCTNEQVLKKIFDDA
jgi:hypothetical protein